jgi:hypothetical protein
LKALQIKNTNYQIFSFGEVVDAAGVEAQVPLLADLLAGQSVERYVLGPEKEVSVWIKLV